MSTPPPFQVPVVSDASGGADIYPSTSAGVLDCGAAWVFVQGGAWKGAGRVRLLTCAASLLLLRLLQAARADKCAVRACINKTQSQSRHACSSTCRVVACTHTLTHNCTRDREMNGTRQCSLSPAAAAAGRKSLSAINKCKRSRRVTQSFPAQGATPTSHATRKKNKQQQPPPREPMHPWAAGGDDQRPTRSLSDESPEP